MSLYLYYCPVCDWSFEILKPMAECERDEPCPRCGVKALRKYTPIPSLVGWRMTEASHDGGGPYCEIEKDI